MNDKEMIIRIYHEILSGKRCRFPNHLFVGNQGKIHLAYITRYLIDEYLRIQVEQIPYKVGAATLWNHRLRPPAKVQGWNYIDVIQNAYPNQFYPWDFNQVPHGYWQGEEGKNGPSIQSGML